MKKEVNGWRIGFFEYHPTYLGLIMGEPTKKMNDRIIHSTIEKRLIRDRKCEKAGINVILNYSGYYGGFEEHDKNEFALKPIMTVFEIFRYEPQEKCYIITFADENEQPEQVIERVTNEKKYKLRKIEWDF